MKKLTVTALAGALTLAGVVLSGGSAEAVVVCRSPGIPAGCVVRPAVRPVAPVARAAVTPAVRPVARPVARPAARAVARPGVPGNRGGPVNRVGRF